MRDKINAMEGGL